MLLQQSQLLQFQARSTLLQVYPLPQLHLKLLIQPPVYQFKLLQRLWLLRSIQLLVYQFKLQPHQSHLLLQFQVLLIQLQVYQLLLKPRLLSTQQPAYR